MKSIARCKKCNALANKNSWKKKSQKERQIIYRKRAIWYTDQAKKGNLKAILQHKLCSFKGNAKRKNIPFDVTVKYLIDLFSKQKGLCYYSGRKLVIAINKGLGYQHFLDTPNHFSLDRLVPEKGYIKGNLVWCCWRINTMKNYVTENQFYDLCQEILDHKQRRNKCR